MLFKYIVLILIEIIRLKFFWIIKISKKKLQTCEKQIFRIILSSSFITNFLKIPTNNL